VPVCYRRSRFVLARLVDCCCLWIERVTSDRQLLHCETRAIPSNPLQAHIHSNRRLKLHPGAESSHSDTKLELATVLPLHPSYSSSHPSSSQQSSSPSPPVMLASFDYGVTRPPVFYVRSHDRRVQWDGVSGERWGVRSGGGVRLLGGACRGGRACRSDGGGSGVRRGKGQLWGESGKL